MSGGSFRYLPDRVLETLGIRPGEVADAIESVIAGRAEGRFCDAPKSVILPGDSRYVMSTLSVGNDDDLTVLKTVEVAPDNPSRELPTTNGAVLVMDARTGLMKALMGANWITGIRTAALSAVAARRLADPQSRVLAFVGCGLQAHSHLEAFAEMFPLSQIRAFGRGRANVQALCDAARARGLDASAPDSAQAALDGADLVVTSITLDYSVKPFLDARWLKPGAFAAITDLGIPWHDESFSAFGRIVIDDRAQEAAMERKLVPPDLVSGDLGDLVTGDGLRHDPARPSAFVFRGIAVGDYAAAALALSRAEARDAGQVLPL